MRNILLVISIFVLSSFNVVEQDENDSAFGYQLSVVLGGSDFNEYCHKIYSELKLEAENLDLNPFQHALKGYFYLKSTQQLSNDRFLTIVDFSKSCKERRLWVVDLYKKQVLFNDLVAHGKYTGQEYAKYFSNRFQSRKSSLGFFVTGSIYNGKHRLSLKLKGMEYGYNHNAFARGIVIHGAHYVHEKYVSAGETIGRSFGCPAVSQEIVASLVDIIDEGSCVFLYYPSQDYLSKSKILNSDMYIPIAELKSLLGE